ncbi:hypothetical protein PI124_g18157 [Phytophthora idaei]|nr:hypothetical protein PI125_g19175 [Phytophthora idaei]KAG3137122.1 hypothetical protein PI126_g17526 [Phytophthora idaei]KAG3236843.1 hypothetical protein PI124_g18157 [Phytophthora idaei]
MVLCGAEKLQLYLAMDYRKWLTSGTIQRIKADLSGFERLESPQRSLLRSGLGENAVKLPDDEEISKGGGHINVIVVVPDYTPGDLFYPDQLRKAAEKEWMKRQKRDVYTYADCPSSKMDELQEALSLSSRLLQIEDDGDNSVPGIEWRDSAQHEESDQYKRYMAHMNDHLKVVFCPDESKMKPRFFLEDTSNKDILSRSGAAWLTFDVSGSADLIIVDRLAKHYRVLFAGLRFVIDVRNNIQEDAERVRRQLMLKLVVADFKSGKQHAPVGLVTDLDKCWYFVWVTTENEITSLELHCAAHGFQFIRDVLSDGSAPSAQGNYTVAKRFVNDEQVLKRRRLNHSQYPSAF